MRTTPAIFRDGTTAEGIHLGAMAGTVDLIQRCYTGIELRDDELWSNPVLPDDLSRLSFQLRYRGHSLHGDTTDDALNVASDPASLDPVTLRLKARLVGWRPAWPCRSRSAEAACPPKE